MTDHPIRLSRRRLLGSVLTVGAAGAATGAGTAAYFTDSETSTGNDVVSGTLDLTLDGGNTTVTFLAATGIVPGDSGQETLAVANAGSLPGYVDVSVAALTNYENGLVGNENSSDGSGGDPGQGNGELQDELEVVAYFQNGGGGNEVYLGSSAYETIATKLPAGTDFDVDHPLAGGASDTFVLEWRLPGSTGNEVQSDGVELELTFQLGQTGGQ